MVGFGDASAPEAGGVKRGGNGHGTYTCSKAAGWVSSFTGLALAGLDACTLKSSWIRYGASTGMAIARNSVVAQFLPPT